jgi:hypothetical protein
MPSADTGSAIDSHEDAGPEVSNLLWTGGWDSTFRLLELLLVYRQPVQPYYLIDPYRASTLHEIRAMARIRQALRRYSPERAATLLPTRMHSTEDLGRDDATREHYESLKRRRNLGAQYEWLALFVARHDVPDLELSVHSDDKFAFIREVAEKRYTPRTGEYWKVRAQDVPPEVALFRPFAFPMLGCSKVRMREIAHAHGFDDLLDQTWFCHRPIRGRPCGLCAPCGFALDEGMAHRIPASGRLRSRVSPLYAAARRLRRRVAERVPGAR